MTSLGYRRGCDHNSVRPGEATTRTAMSIAMPTTSPSPPAQKKAMHCYVPKGFLPLSFFATIFLIAPILFDYVDYTWTDAATRGGHRNLSRVRPVYTACQRHSRVVQHGIVLSHRSRGKGIGDSHGLCKLDTTGDGDKILAWSGFVIIIVHLLPFLLIDHTKILTLLAFAGVIVNASALVYLTDPSIDLRLMLVGFSSAALLGTTLCISGMCDVSTSMLTALRKAMTDGTWLKCSSYSM